MTEAEAARQAPALPRAVPGRKQRHRVLLLLASLSVLTYLDRVCISVAGPRLQNDLHLDAADWGLVTGAFAIAYALFEIPGGYWGDKFGARAMLTRVVLWWSAFTALTGLATGLWSLVTVRFFFGAGEAGGYPTASTSVLRWFPPVERGRAFSIMLLSGQLGAAIAPFLIVPMQMRFGWRPPFYVFGAVGVLWSVLWWRGYRNRPAAQPGISAAELGEAAAPASAHRFPWRALVGSRSLWALMASACAYLYSYYFFLFWLPTYLVRARGFSEADTRWSALPFVVGAACNLAGGFARDAAVRRFGRTRGPRRVGQVGLATAALAAVAANLSTDNTLALAWLALCYGGITFQQPSVFATCAEIGRSHAGVVTGCMNSAAALGGLLSSLIFGALVQATGNYTAVLYSMAAALAGGAACWCVIDAARPLLADPPAMAPPADALTRRA